MSGGSWMSFSLLGLVCSVRGSCYSSLRLHSAVPVIPPCTYCHFVLFAQRCFRRGVRSWDGSCCFATRKAGRTILQGSYPCNPPWTLWAPWNPPSLIGESQPSLQEWKRVQIYHVADLLTEMLITGVAMAFCALNSATDNRGCIITARPK